MLKVSVITLYSIRSEILSQWSHLKTGMMWWWFGILVTARARAFRIAWRCFSWVMSMFRKSSKI